MKAVRGIASQRRRQDEIRDAAAEVFAKSGYHGATTLEIAKQLGIQQASLYYYFRSKEIALEAVCMKGAQDFLDVAQQVVAKPNTATEHIRELMVAHIMAIETQPYYVRTFLNESRHLARHYKKAFRKVSRSYESLIEKTVLRGVLAGEFRLNADPRLTTLGILGLCKSVAAWHDKETFRTESTADFYATVFLSGLRREH